VDSFLHATVCIRNMIYTIHKQTHKKVCINAYILLYTRMDTCLVCIMYVCGSCILAEIDSTNGVGLGFPPSVMALRMFLSSTSCRFFLHICVFTHAYVCRFVCLYVLFMSACSVVERITICLNVFISSRIPISHKPALQLLAPSA